MKTRALFKNSHITADTKNHIHYLYLKNTLKIFSSESKVLKLSNFLPIRVIDFSQFWVSKILVKINLQKCMNSPKSNIQSHQKFSKNWWATRCCRGNWPPKKFTDPETHVFWIGMTWRTMFTNVILPGMVEAR